MNASPRGGLALAVFLHAGCADPAPGGSCQGFLEAGTEGCASRAWPTAGEPFAGPGASDVTLALSTNGAPIVGWAQDLPASVSKQAMLGEPGGNGWVLYEAGDPSNGAGQSPHVAIAHDGSALAAWTQNAVQNRSATYLARRTAEGEWSDLTAGERFSFGDTAYEPRPYIEPSGEAFLVWNQGTQGGYGVAVARQAPGTPLGEFRFPTDVSDLLSPQILFSNAPQLAVAGNGDALVTWYQSVGNGLSIFVSERDGQDGSFSRPSASAKISPDGGRVADHRARNPVVAMGPRGTGLVVWSQHHPSGKIGLYAAERDGFRRWTLPRDIDDTFAPLREHATCADVVTTSAEETFVVWFDGPPGATSVYFAHRDEAGEWDSPWPTGERLSAEDVQAYAPSIATGGDGEVVAVWSEFRDGVWAVVGRRRSPNASAWGSAHRLSDPQLGDALNPAVALNANGDIGIAWEQGGFGQRRVVFAR